MNLKELFLLLSVLIIFFIFFIGALRITDQIEKYVKQEYIK